LFDLSATGGAPNLSRLRIFALLATCLAAAAVLGACGGGGSSSEDPQTVIEEATLKGIKSGDLDLSVHAKGSKGGSFDFTASGPFQGGGGENLPELDVGTKLEGSLGERQIHFEGGLVLLADRAYVEYEGTTYEVDPTTFGFVKSSLEQAEQQGSKRNPGNVSACQEAAAGLEVSQFVKHLKNEGSADVDGTSTTKISGELDVSAALDALVKLTEVPACATQLRAAGPLPLARLEAAKDKVANAVKKAHADVYVGDDHIIRKVTGEVTIAPKAGESGLQIEFELAIGGVNEGQEIAAPSGAKPLEQLFLKLHINPLELLEPGGAGIGRLLEVIGARSLAGGDKSSQKAFLECLQKAQAPVDLQNCASLKP
jgi:hypothetical protein